MTSDSPDSPKAPGRAADAARREAARRLRQAAALRENLKKRKTQARAKRAGADADDGQAG